MNTNNYGITEDTVLTDLLVLDICIRQPSGKMKGVVSSDKWLNDHPKIKEYLLTRYDDFDSVGEILYRMKHNIESRPVCPICGGRIKFKSFSSGFYLHCSIKCLNKDLNHIKQCLNTCLIKYGGKNPMASTEIKNKSKETCLKKYGCEYSLQSKEIREKSKQTCLKKYGKEYYGIYGSEEFTQLIRDKYGVDNPFLAEEIKEKMKETHMQKYGVPYVSQSPEIKEKVKQTNLERYGAEFYLQTEEGKNKIKQTNLEKYGVEYIAQSKEFLQKIRESNLQKYGVEYVSLIPEAKEKLKLTCLKRYGVEHVLLNSEFSQKVINTKRKNHTFNTSNIEKEFEEYLRLQNFTIQTQYSSELYPFCCDFYIKEYDLYIEIQGNWTHGRHPFDPENEKDI